MTSQSSIEEGSHKPIKSKRWGFMICIIIMLAFGVLFGVFIWWIVYLDERPDIEFNITEASTTQFNIENNNTVHYKFNIGFTVRNLVKEVRDFDKNIAILSYKGNQIATVNTASFILGSKDTVKLEPIVFEGSKLIELNPKQLVEYNNETKLGIYNLHFQLYHHVKCPTLRIPMISDAKLAPTFKVTKCSCDRTYQ